MITANQAPDHTTIARFRQRHETALAGLFGDVLALGAEAGLVNVGVIAIDGTKLHANASEHANRKYEQLAARDPRLQIASSTVSSSASASITATSRCSSQNGLSCTRRLGSVGR